MKKYELLTAGAVRLGSRELYLVRALRDFGDVRKGDIGGRIEGEQNLSHNGRSWVGGDAWVYGNGRVRGDEVVAGNVVIRDRVRVPMRCCGQTLGDLEPR
ncbi:MAG: hypothetical protein ACREQ4_14135 [Candidatus Binataceae bacterium]